MSNTNLNMLKNALKLLAKEEIAAMDRIVENSPTPPIEIYVKCNEKAQEIIDSQKKAPSFKKAVTVLIAATLVISLLGIVAYAAREKIGGFYIKFFERYAELTHDENLENRIDSSKVEISYIPSGFEETRRKLGIASGLYEWKSGDSVITFMFNIVAKGYCIIDTEDSNYVIIEIDGIQVHKTEKLGQTNFTWIDEKLTYTLSTNGVDLDEMINIFKSIKYSG